MLRLSLVALFSLALTAGAQAQTNPGLPPTVSALQVQARPSAAAPTPAPTLPPGPVLVTMADGTQVPVFGSDLFSGAFASARPGALIGWIADLEASGMLVDRLGTTDNGDRTVAVQMTLKAQGQ
jgi:hypothetical protein